MSQYQTPPQSFGQPAGGSYPTPPAAASQSSGGILDIRFTRFLSLGLISVWWVVALIGIALGAMVGVIVGFVMMGTDGVGRGLLLVIGSLIGSVVLAVLTRLFLESIAVLFRIADNTSEMAKGRRF